MEEKKHNAQMRPEDDIKEDFETALSLPINAMWVFSTTVSAKYCVFTIHET